MQGLIACIDLARSPGLNPDLHSLGILPTMFDARSLHCRQVLALLRQHYPDAVSETVIRRTMKLADAYARNLPITEYDRQGEVTQAFRRLAREVLMRPTRPDILAARGTARPLQRLDSHLRGAAADAAALREVPIGSCGCATSRASWCLTPCSTR